MKSSWSQLWAVDCLTATLEINDNMEPLQIVVKRSDNVGEHRQGKPYILEQALMCIMLVFKFGLQQVQVVMAVGKHSQEQSPQTWCQLIGMPGWCMLRPCGSYRSQTSHPQTGSSSRPV